MLLLQCKKKDLKYKAVAMEVTGQVAKALSVDCFSELFELTLTILKPSEGEGGGWGGAVDEGGREEAREQRVSMLELQVKAVDALGDAWPDSERTQGKQYYNTP